VSLSASPTPGLFELAKDEEGGAQVEAQAREQRDGAHDQISAADYDPSLDRREDEKKRVLGVKDEPDQEVEVIEEEDEDDLDDMFAVASNPKRKIKKTKTVVVS
jgi:serine/threonine-protein kinase PRP4